jgi:hypothetical protein
MITVANFLDLNLGLIDWHALAILKKRRQRDKGPFNYYTTLYERGRLTTVSPNDTQSHRRGTIWSKLSIFILGLLIFSLIENRLIKRKKAFKSSFLAISFNFVL